MPGVLVDLTVGAKKTEREGWERNKRRRERGRELRKKIEREGRERVRERERERARERVSGVILEFLV